MNEIGQNNPGVERQGMASVGSSIACFIRKQGAVLYVALGMVILVAFGFGFYIIKNNRDNDQASRLLAVAQTPEQFEALLRQYPKTTSAPEALLALASSRYSAGYYDSALEHYREFIDKYPKYPILGVAELGKVMCSEARGEMEKALIGFNAFILAHPGHFLMPQALFGKARCLRATGKLIEARTVYEDFIVANPESKWLRQAEAYLNALNRQMRSQVATANPAGEE